jgi:hypothetical protein
MKRNTILAAMVIAFAYSAQAQVNEEEITVKDYNGK